MAEVAAAPAPNAAPPSTEAGGAPAATPEIPPNPLSWDPEQKAYVAKQKIDGAERVAKWDEIQRDAQLSAAAQKRFEEAKAIKVSMGELEQKARVLEEYIKDPRRTMRAWAAQGYDPREVLAVLQADIEAEAKMSPQERELRELRAREAQRQQEAIKQQETQRQQQEEAAETAETQRIEGIFQKNFDKRGLPPEDKSSVRAHMSVLMWGMHDKLVEKGERAKASELEASAWGEMKSLAKDVIAMLAPEERAQLLGSELVSAFAQTHMSQAPALPGSVPQNHHSQSQPRRNGQFSKHTVFASGGAGSFTRMLDKYSGGR